MAQEVVKKHEDDPLCEIINISPIGPTSETIDDAEHELSPRCAVSDGAAVHDPAPPGFEGEIYFTKLLKHLSETIARSQSEAMTPFQKTLWKKNRVKRLVAATKFNEAGLSDGEDEFLQCFSFTSCETSDNIKRLLMIVSMVQITAAEERGEKLFSQFKHLSRVMHLHIPLPSFCSVCAVN